MGAESSAGRFIARSPKAKPMAVNMYSGWWSFVVCILVTVAVSLVTKPKPISELKNLVWAATEMPSTGHEPWYKRPVVLAVAVAVVCIAFNILFW